MTETKKDGRAQKHGRVKGEYLRRLRMELGMSQEEVAQESGITRKLLCAYENNHSDNMWATTAIRLARVLCVQVEDLFEMYEVKA